jgi:TolB-like protein
MSSIIPGYEYDIFISYRQKDNKHDGWVTEFVSKLKGELESTFKEEISVYFDINSHDGLLENHDVDASLKEKLKCLIFIPIISRTYCDPKSFAWEHEFKAFVEMASNDLFGLKVKLPNGNIANRVLPVQIHDLDQDDKKMLEGVLGYRIRGVDFIYSEQGVNRPLKMEDKEEKNLNGTKYLNQINKVSNAIREIMNGLKTPEKVENRIKSYESKNPGRRIGLTPILVAAVILLIALILAGVFIIHKPGKQLDEFKKSIAVLPFTNDSPEKSDDSFINGVMSELIGCIQKIKSFTKVLPRISVEKYRNTSTPIPEIAKDLQVNYIVYADGQRYGESFRIHLYLVNSENKILWNHSYEGKLKTEEIFETYSKIANEVASALKIEVTPEEKQSIRKTSTSNLTAYDLYQRAKEELGKVGNGFRGYELDNNTEKEIERASELFKQALTYDTTFAPAYAGLATVYWYKHFWKEYFSQRFMDSVLIYSNIALSYDNQITEAFIAKGFYYWSNGTFDKAIDEFDKGLKLNSNLWEAYYYKGRIYESIDFGKSIDNLLKSASLNHGDLLPEILSETSEVFSEAGFADRSIVFAKQALILDADSSKYYFLLGENEKLNGKFEKACELYLKANELDSNNLNYLVDGLGEIYFFLGQYKESLKYFKKAISKGEKLGELSLNYLHRVGFDYLKIGNRKEAEYYFEKQIEFCNKTNNLGRWYGQGLYSYYDLSGVYAAKSDKKKAFENLRIFNRIKTPVLWMVTYFKHDPLFNSIRDESEFQEIAKDIETRYLLEHEKVRKWLEEQEQI